MVVLMNGFLFMVNDYYCVGSTQGNLMVIQGVKYVHIYQTNILVIEMFSIIFR